MRTTTESKSMGFAEVSTMLWRERDALQLLLFKLVEEQLIVSCRARTRWLAQANDEIEFALEQLRGTEVLRAAETDAISDELGLPASATLAELEAAAPEPWATLFAEHRRALLQLVAEVEQVTGENRSLLTAGARAVRETLLSVTQTVQTYDASGSAAPFIGRPGADGRAGMTESCVLRPDQCPGRAELQRATAWTSPARTSPTPTPPATSASGPTWPRPARWPGCPSLYATQHPNSSVTVSGTTRLNDPVIDMRARSEHGQQRLPADHRRPRCPRSRACSTSRATTAWPSSSTTSGTPGPRWPTTPVTWRPATWCCRRPPALAGSLNESSAALTRLTQSVTQQVTDGHRADQHRGQPRWPSSTARSRWPPPPAANTNSLADQRDSLLMKPGRPDRRPVHHPGRRHRHRDHRRPEPGHRPPPPRAVSIGAGNQILVGGTPAATGRRHPAGAGWTA